MAYKMFMDLHLFEGGAAGAGAGAAPAAGTGEGGEAAVVTPGTLDDGTQVDARLAARMQEQERKRRNRGEQPRIRAARAEVPAAQEEAKPAEEQAQPSLEDEWTEAKKGKYKELYSRDIQETIKDRFKNQNDAQKQLDNLQPMLNAMMKKTGVDSVEELSKLVLDDDSLYEEEAEKAGMTTEGYKQYIQMVEENRQLKEREQQEQENQFIRMHLAELTRQGEELKKIYPSFDLMQELQNPTFKRLTAPNSGLSVEAAYFAVHHKELEPQAMAYGIQRAQQQISQTIQANRARPVEGAMKSGQPADIAIDPRTMTREQRQKLIERARRGEKIII